MKVYNAIIVFDCYVVAESEEAAQAALLASIRTTDEADDPTEWTVLEARNPRDVRESWESKRPFVGADVSDEDFETLKGKTTKEIHAMIYAKEEKPK